jgi:hypothetical protein
MEIMTLEEQDVPRDAPLVTVTGTLINRGQGPTTQLTVRVDALDDQGRVVATAPAVPASERVEANGTVTFTATLENRPETRHYHVEAVAR